MKTSSAKAKGRRLSQHLCDALMKCFNKSLKVGDILVTPSGVNGPDVSQSPLAQSLHPFDFECKNQEKISLWSSIAQAEQHTAKTGRVPALVVSRNRMKEPYVCMPMSAFLKLLNPGYEHESEANSSPNHSV